MHGPSLGLPRDPLARPAAGSRASPAQRRDGSSRAMFLRAPSRCRAKVALLLPVWELGHAERPDVTAWPGARDRAQLASLSCCSDVFDVVQ